VRLAGMEHASTEHGERQRARQHADLGGVLHLRRGAESEQADEQAHGSRCRRARHAVTLRPACRLQPDLEPDKNLAVGNNNGGFPSR
jgi:hypothetical protein